HTSQSTIARIERGDNVSLDKLDDIARALGKKLVVEFA
ncbi:helix-turn-helix domain-containing protein, partial [Enterococcus faecalis]